MVESGGIDLIKPFLVHTLCPKQDVYIGPSQPTAISIALATTQRLPSVTHLPEFGLPLKHDWTLSPLDHLLRSGTSTIFQALPADWRGSELGVVRASLLFTLATRDVLVNYGLGEFCLGREEAIFNCMKIFMLEHEQPQTDSSVEVFRDATVTRSMEILLQPFTLGAISNQSPPDAVSGAKENLETVASGFLGSSTPFFQYYTDFVALYDAISFAHPLFSRLLLPPLSMRYAVDYRKHLWGDFGHVIKTVKTPVEQVITADIREYLYPVEDNAQMLRSYVLALVHDIPKGFLRLVAIHHVASNIWPDLGEDTAVFDEDRAFGFLKTVIEQGNREVARNVISYRQTKEGVLPLSCYEVDATVKELRKAIVKRWRGGDLSELVEGLF